MPDPDPTDETIIYWYRLGRQSGLIQAAQLFERLFNSGDRVLGNPQMAPAFLAAIETLYEQADPEQDDATKH